MDKLSKARQTINEVDKKMAELFRLRMEAVRTVAEYKKERGLPVLDASREAEVLRRNEGYIGDGDLRSYYRLFLKTTMDISKQYQHRLIEGARVAYSGVEGAFAHIAAKKIFPDGTPVAHTDFEEAYRSVVIGECDYAVLPIENSYAGEVGQVMDLMFAGELFVSGIYDLHITQNLIGVKGAALDGIHTVISHPQALQQCEKYIHTHGFTQVSATNTAKAASEIAEKGDVHIAAIASKETAALYGLSVLDHDINESAMNTTRFAVFSRVANGDVSEKENTFLLLFQVRNLPGALANAINVIAAHGFNMKVLRSRPAKDQPFRYYFYVEAEGDETSDAGKSMLEELKNHCDMLKVAGRYKFEIDVT